MTAKRDFKGDLFDYDVQGRVYDFLCFCELSMVVRICKRVRRHILGRYINQRVSLSGPPRSLWFYRDCYWWKTVFERSIPYAKYFHIGAVMRNDKLLHDYIIDKLDRDGRVTRLGDMLRVSHDTTYINEVEGVCWLSDTERQNYLHFRNNPLGEVAWNREFRADKVLSRATQDDYAILDLQGGVDKLVGFCAKGLQKHFEPFAGATEMCEENLRKLLQDLPLIWNMHRFLTPGSALLLGVNRILRYVTPTCWDFIRMSNERILQHSWPGYEYLPLAKSVMRPVGIRKDRLAINGERMDKMEFINTIAQRVKHPRSIAVNYVDHNVRHVLGINAMKIRSLIVEEPDHCFIDFLPKCGDVRYLSLGDMRSSDFYFFQNVLGRLGGLEHLCLCDSGWDLLLGYMRDWQVFGQDSVILELRTTYAECEKRWLKGEKLPEYYKKVSHVVVVDLLERHQILEFYLRRLTVERQGVKFPPIYFCYTPVPDEQLRLALYRLGHADTLLPLKAAHRPIRPSPRWMLGELKADARYELEVWYSKLDKWLPSYIRADPFPDDENVGVLRVGSPWLSKQIRRGQAGLIMSVYSPIKCLPLFCYKDLPGNYCG